MEQSPPHPALYLLVAVVEDEDDGSREEDGHEADAQTEDPVVNDGDVEVECGEDGAPRHHVEHLLVREEGEGRRRKVSGLQLELELELAEGN